jgi:hypothetical protein
MQPLELAVGEEAATGKQKGAEDMAEGQDTRDMTSDDVEGQKLPRGNKVGEDDVEGHKLPRGN